MYCACHFTPFKAELINIFILTTGKITICNMKGVLVSFSQLFFAFISLINLISNSSRRLFSVKLSSDEPTVHPLPRTKW